MSPASGEDVRIFGPHTRLRGLVTSCGSETLTIELEQTPIRRPFRFPAGSQVEVEWTHPSGVMQLTATVDSAHEDPRPTLELQLVGAAEPIERREHERVPVNLEVSAWSLAQPTRRISGNTVDLSVSGALLRLPDLAPLSATVEVWIALPHSTVQASAVVRWRREPGLVGIQFERIDPEDQARLVTFLRDSR